MNTNPIPEDNFVKGFGLQLRSNNYASLNTTFEYPVKAGNIYAVSNHPNYVALYGVPVRDAEAGEEVPVIYRCDRIVLNVMAPTDNLDDCFIGQPLDTNLHIYQGEYILQARLSSPPEYTVAVLLDGGLPTEDNIMFEFGIFEKFTFWRAEVDFLGLRYKINYPSLPPEGID